MGWKARVLSQAGKMMLIKSTLKVIALYTRMALNSQYISIDIDSNDRISSRILIEHDLHHSTSPLISWAKFVNLSVKRAWQ